MAENESPAPLRRSLEVRLSAVEVAVGSLGKSISKLQAADGELHRALFGDPTRADDMGRGAIQGLAIAATSTTASMLNEMGKMETRLAQRIDGVRQEFNNRIGAHDKVAESSKAASTQLWIYVKASLIAAAGSSVIAVLIGALTHGHL